MRITAAIRLSGSARKFGMPDRDLLEILNTPKIAVHADAAEVEACNPKGLAADLTVPKPSNGMESEQRKHPVPNSRAPGSQDLHTLAEVYRLIATTTRTAPHGPITGSPLAREQSTQHSGVRTTTGSDRDAVDFNLDAPAIWPTHLL